jgi:hypothetical protein
MHDENDAKSTRHPNIIFKKNKEGNYTKNALLSQDILQYCINGKYKEDDNISFRLWNLAKWLLEVNSEFKNYFKDLSTRNITKRNRVENRLPRIKLIVKELANLGIIVQAGTAKETKGTGLVPIFRFTEVGNMMAWVVESMNADKRTRAENQLYELFQNHYKKEPSSSIDIFCSIYYRKCRERGLFEDLIEYYRKVGGIPVLLLGRPEFTRNLTLVPPDNTEFWKLWNDAVMELDSDIKTHLFHHIKLEIERKAEETCQAFGTFERVRYRTKDRPGFVTIEGQCKNCKGYVSAAFPLNEYMQEVLESYPSVEVIRQQCPACKNNECLEFSLVL